MAEWHESADREGGFVIAGWRDSDGQWIDVENGGRELESSTTPLWEVDDMTVRYTNPAGDDIYLTVHGPWEDYESLSAIVDDAMDAYGIQ